MSNGACVAIKGDCIGVCSNQTPAKLKSAVRFNDQFETGRLKKRVLRLSKAGYYLGRGNKKLRKMDALTSLRFFAALAIVVQHSKDAFKAMAWIGNFPFDYGVSFFFVLSGFILTYVYREFSSYRALRDFYIARIARIWPLHLFTFLLFLVLIPVGSWIVGGSGKDVMWVTLANLFLVQSWIPSVRYFFSFNGVSWSISTEIFFYLMFPLLRHRWSETWHWKVLLVVTAIGCILTIATARGVPDIDFQNATAISSSGIAYIWPFVRIGEFVLGMIAGSIFISMERRVTSGIIVWTILEVIALSSVWILQNMIGELPSRIAGHSLGITPWTIFFAHSCAAGGFALIILTIAIARGLFSRLLSVKPLVLLGEASFALYLVHHMLISAYYFYRPAFDGIPDTILCISYWIVSIASAFALWIFIEKPCREKLKTWLLKRDDSPKTFLPDATIKQ